MFSIFDFIWEESIMAIKRVTLIVLFSLVAAVGCTTKEISYVPPPSTPAPPSLAKQLDNLFKKDHNKWREQMSQLLTSGKTNLPVRHLAHAIREFNGNETKKLCLEAAYLYLRNTAGLNGGKLTPSDRKLFRSYVEYALKSPDTYAMRRVKSLCRLIQDMACRELG
jgi:hypothetical protein